MIKVIPTAQAAASEDLSQAATVIIDVLRATSVMAQALENGAQRVITVPTIEQAFALQERLGKEKTLLGGERNADPIEGFDLGNSPETYTKEKVEGKDVILTTTNGTLALENSRSSAKLYTACVLNYEATAQRLAEHARKDGLDIVIVCAGTNGRFTLEDAYCASFIIQEIENISGRNLSQADYADDFTIGIHALAHSVSKIGEISPLYIKRTTHYNRLIAKGYAKDLSFCLCPSERYTSVCEAIYSKELNAVFVSPNNK